MSPRPPQDPNTADTPTRVAVIVVPGVGDDGLGDTVDTLADSLVRRGHFDWASHDAVTVTPQGSQGALDPGTVEVRANPYHAPRRRLGRGHAPPPPSAVSAPTGTLPRDGDGDLRVDLYEMNWADLSRFPSGLLRFIFALFGLLLQMLRVGIESMRRLGGGRSGWTLTGIIRDRRRPALDAFTEAVTRALAWWFAVAVVPVTALVVMMGTATWMATLVDDGLLIWAVLVLGVAVALWLLYRIGRGMHESGVHHDMILGAVVEPGTKARNSPASPIISVFTITIVSVIFGVLIGRADEASTIGVRLANTLLGVMAGPLRAVWIVALLLSAAAIIATGAIFVRQRARRDGALAGGMERAAGVNMLGVTVAPFLIAIVSGLVLASAGLVGAQSLGAANWGAATADLRCLETPASWFPTPCLDEAEARDLGIAAANVERLAPVEEVTPLEEIARAQARAEAEENVDLLISLAGADTATWLEDLAEPILQPVIVAALLLLALLALALVARLLSAARGVGREAGADRGSDYRLGAIYLVWRLFSRPGPRHDDRRAALSAGGRALTGTLERIAGLTTLAGLAVAALLAVVMTLVIWGWTGLVPEVLLTGVAAPLTLGVTALLLIARFVPIDPRRPGASAGWLERARVSLDIGHDVVTYLREGHTAARFPVVSRYRALLAQVLQMRHDDGTEGYSGVIFAAHSQGTVYTAATLFGDAAREPVVWDLPTAEERTGDSRVSEGLARTSSVSFLSFGSPIKQLYVRFFPDQYEAWRLGAAVEDGAFWPLTDTWTNIYRPADYIGRSVHRRWNDDEVNSAGNTWSRALRPPGAADREPSELLHLREHCLDEAGAHTKYWSSPHVARHLMYLIHRAAGTRSAGRYLPEGMRRVPQVVPPEASTRRFVRGDARPLERDSARLTDPGPDEPNPS